MTTTLDSLSAGKYLSLTTFKKDDSPVATPVWLVRDGDALRIITDASSGKAKRIRNNGHVLVGPCDSRGRLKGPQVPAVAELVDAADTERTAGLIVSRYGLLGRAMMWRSQRRAKKTGEITQVGIRVTLTG